MFESWKERRRQRKAARQKALENEDKKTRVLDRLDRLQKWQIIEAIQDPTFREDAEWLSRVFPSDYSGIWNKKLLSFEVEPDKFDPEFEDEIFTLSVFLAGIIEAREDIENLKREVEDFQDRLNRGGSLEDEDGGYHQSHQHEMCSHCSIEVLNINTWLSDANLSFTSLRNLLLHTRVGLLDLYESNVARIMNLIDVWPDQPDGQEIRYRSDANSALVYDVTPIDPKAWQRDRGQAIETWQSDRAGKPEPDAQTRFWVAKEQPQLIESFFQSHEGRAAMFVFDKDKLGGLWGYGVFEAIKLAIARSTGSCAFVDGDLEVSVGGAEGVPALLMGMRDNGWKISSHWSDSPLVLLAGLEKLSAYVVGLWTDNVEIIDVLNTHLAETLKNIDSISTELAEAYIGPESYLGYLSYPQHLDTKKFFEILRPLQLPKHVSYYVDGQLESYKSTGVSWQDDSAGESESEPVISRTEEMEQSQLSVSPATQSNNGRAAIFVFDYDKMSSTYGSEVFRVIESALADSTGVCAFLDGDLEVSCGGPADVPALLMEIRDNGWNISSHRTDSPLVLLAALDRLCAYVAGLWTDHPENIDVIDAHLAQALVPREGYLGYLSQPHNLDIRKFYEIARPLQLPVRATYVDGEKVNT